MERLIEHGCRVELYYSNSNINTPEEFEKRLECVVRLADFYGIPSHTDPYDHKYWLDTLRTHFAAPEGGSRCVECVSRVLRRTCGKAQELGIPAFATSLTVSPHKNSKIIFAAGNGLPGFEAVDFKKKNGFLRSIRLSEKFGFYRQDYCGCEFSVRN